LRLLLLLLLLDGAAFAQDQFFARYNAATPGAAVAVVRDGRVVLAKGYGTAHLEYGVPITPRTVFQAASVSKQFTAFAIYLLEKTGRLALTSEARQYVEGVPRGITIQHLLAHTSGLRDQWALLTLAGWRMDDVITNAQALRLLHRQKELNHPPGRQYLYTNSGYTLLAEIVQRVSGQSLAEFTRQHIFQPLGMKDTQFVEDFRQVVSNRAESYDLVGGVYQKSAANISTAGATNLYTTAEDMTKWALNFEKPVVGGAELIRRFLEPSLLDNGERVVASMADGEPIYHAKGQLLGAYRGVRFASHGGHQAGFRSSFRLYPDQRLAIVTLSNDEHYAQLENLERLSDLYLRGELPRPAAAAAVAAPVVTPAVAISGDLSMYVGDYYSEELDTAYSAQVHQGRLVLRHIRHGEIPLQADGGGKFRGRIEFPVTCEFVRGAAGPAGELLVSNFGAKNVRFVRRTR